MHEWWNALSADQQVFAGMAILGSVALAIQVLLMLIGLDHSDLSVGDADTGSAGEHSSGLSFISVRTVIAFVVGFGWTGLVLSTSGWSSGAAAAVGLAVGMVMMASIFWIMRSLLKFTYSGTLNYQNAVGQSGNVYQTIPAAMAAPGQIEIMIQGRLCIAPAMTRSATPLAPRSRAKVVELVDRTTLLVEPLL